MTDLRRLQYFLAGSRCNGPATLGRSPASPTNGCMAIFTVRDGRIQEVREYMDTLYASRVFAGARAPA